jgi:hypothetical protein
MKKANTTSPTPATLTATDADIARLADYLASVHDAKRGQLSNSLEECTNSARHYRERAGSLRDDAIGSDGTADEYEETARELTEKLADLPPPQPADVEVARADLLHAAALPFIQSIEVSDEYVIAHTKKNSLYTLFRRKYSHAERWYKVKPYRVPLPAYTIRFTLRPIQSLSQNDNALAIQLTNYRKDTANFIDWTHRYTQQPHPHWGCVQTSGFSRVCLGEYESEVSAAFRKSIADGLVALATYLQASGAEHGYITNRERWGLWLGKEEYNALLIPSVKEVIKDEAEDEEENDRDSNVDRYNEDGEPDDEGEYDENGELID